ncbi:nitroreductase [Thermomonas sp.]|uniref:nitroreductase family protein n=1 Tax=Thermomonas sp. TaxID=1971895 RepID=UPI002629A7EB|nr:nitroreductase [Thermomonas sp.]
MLTLDDLDSRLSIPTRQLGEPGPSPARLLRMLQTAVRVPDHGKRVPFRFLRIAGEARTALAEAAVRRLREREPDCGTAVEDKLRTRFTLPPVTVAVIARLGEDEKIPESERFTSAAYTGLMLLLAAQSEGFGAQLLTGWLAYDRPFLETTLGLSPDERLIGTIAIGTPQIEIRDRPRPDAAALLTDWRP